MTKSDMVRARNRPRARRDTSPWLTRIIRIEVVNPTTGDLLRFVQGGLHDTVARTRNFVPLFMLLHESLMTMDRIARTNKVALKALFMAHETCIKVACNGIIK